MGYDRAVVTQGFKLLLRDFDPSRPLSTGIAAHKASKQFCKLTLLAFTVSSQH